LLTTIRDGRKSRRSVAPRYRVTFRQCDDVFQRWQNNRELLPRRICASSLSPRAGDRRQPVPLQPVRDRVRLGVVGEQRGGDRVADAVARGAVGGGFVLVVEAVAAAGQVVERGGEVLSAG
jgi:hypothetical protein